MSHKPDEFLTPDELVSRWKGKVKAGTLRNWRTSGKGPKATKIGGAMLYKISEVEKYERDKTA